MDRTAGKSSKVSMVIKALLVTYVITIVCLLLLAFLLYKFGLGEDKIQIGILAVYVISSFVGGYIAGKVEQNKKFLWGLLIGVLYVALLFVLSAILHKGIQGNMIEILTTFAICIGGGMIGGMLS